MRWRRTGEEKNILKGKFKNVAVEKTEPMLDTGRRCRRRDTPDADAARRTVMGCC